ncbi:hypothetical protein ACH5RR_041576 [Cinchona calisaya]|uniref:Major facilitator superfamily (MFS) profile domain-containing protein n=1 Tax=Cinchona calisaya TaxID=153742 RepID=A0ABD2XZT2_9GENT
MADSTPLLSNSASTNLPYYEDCLEDLIEPYIKGFRWSQALQVILISLASFFEAQQTFITIFTDAKPSWHCTQSTANTTCNSTSNICEIPANSWHWDKPARSSIVSEWSLICPSDQIVSGLPSSSFFVGCLLGGIILSFLGDSHGRKKLLVLSCLTMSTASILIAFSRNIWVYSGLRLLSGFGRAAIGSCVLVLSTESVGKQWRGQVGIIGFFCSTLGFLSLPALAYFNRFYSWRSLYLLTSIPAIVYCLLIQFCVYESPKWLIEQGKLGEALAVLNTHAHYPDCNDSGFSMKYYKNKNQTRKVDSNQSLITTLLKNKSVLQQLILAMSVGFGIGMVYYGIPLGVGNLDFNIYLSAAFNALLEIPSAALTFYLAKCRRRCSLLALSTVSGVCGIACILVGKWKGLQMGLELTSFFSACAAFNLLLIYAVEIFPTSTRNSALSMVWQAIVLSGAISPLVIAIAEDYNKILPHFVFGVLILILGSLVIFLPETMSGNHSITLAEQEEEHDDQLC